MKLKELRNRYSNEIVYCKNIDDIVVDTHYTFIKVFKKELPERTYLVNREAYEVLTK
jgi:hypothetical protein